ncbi:cytochrome P450 [Apiospora rasikravindrae]|uniref:Cytochrome P450 n=1 Tax=Apiospora rasikravindrae TaxID=990691 RepID=A0ABR1RYJ2_9PEZI
MSPENMAAQTGLDELLCRLSDLLDSLIISPMVRQPSATISIFLLMLVTLWALLRSTNQRAQSPVVNRLCSLELSLFSRIRWCLWAREILDAADQKAQDRPYRLARGDKELVVLPVTLIQELNRLGTDTLDSRQSHAFVFLSHLTGLQRTVKASYQTRILQRRVTPALPDLFAPMANRISAAIKRHFPAAGNGNDWKTVMPLPAATACFSEGMCLVLFGTEMSARPRLVELASKLAEDLFSVAFMMRLVPATLQPILVWFLPAKWRLNAKWRELETFLAPEVRRQQQQKALADEGNHECEASRKKDTGSTPTDLLTWMVRDGSTPFEQDPSVLTTLCGSVAAASINSIANLVCHMVADLAAHPDVLDQVRAEIRTKHKRIGGKWDMATLSTGLDKLESAMKETARLASSPLIVYSRVVRRDLVLPLDGGTIHLQKGQFITMSGRARTMDPTLFEDPERYKGLRFCEDEDSLAQHRARAFSTVDTDILTWGAGRSACPGRLIADIAVKVFLIPLLDEYDFAFADGKPFSQRAMLHEFVFFHPHNSMLMRRRMDAVGIKFH